MNFKKNITKAIFFIFTAYASLTANQTSLQNVSLQLNSTISFEFAGYFMALENGYYEEEGLNVKILERDFHINNVKQVIKEKVNYSITDSTILLSRAKGSNVQIMASIFQHSPQILITHENSNVYTPLEMNEKTISYPKNIDNAATLTLLHSFGLNHSNYNYVPSNNTYEDFLDGRIDVISAHSGRIFYELMDADIDFNIINPINYGIDLYDGILFSTENELTNYPQRSKSFLDASLRGWHYAMDNKEKTAKILLEKYHSKASMEQMLYEANLYEKLMVRKLVDIGYTNPGRFYKVARTYEETNLANSQAIEKALQNIVWDPNAQKVDYKKYLYIFLTFLLIVVAIIFSLLLISRKLKKTVIQRTKEINEKNVILQEVQKIAHLGSWNYDALSKNLEWSDEIYRIFGEEPQSFNPNKEKYLSYIHPDDLQNVKTTCNDTSNKQYEIQYKIVRSSGELRYIRENVLLHYDEDNNLLQSIGTVYDITKTTIHEQELKEQTKKALASNVAKSEFLANMSHEIRTPLNAIMGFIDIIKAKEKDPKNIKYLHVINSSSKDLLSIINDILDFSKLESGTIDIEQHYFNPTHEFMLTKKLFEAKINEKNIKLHFTLATLPVSLKGDVLRIKQVLNNLLSNAIKFTAENKNIYLNIDYKSNKLMVNVKDEGIGISKEYQKTIFEPFSQEDNSTTRKYGGTGLGLSISNTLVQLMGGQLSVKSTLGNGSEFSFYIPLKKGHQLHTKENNQDEIQHQDLDGHILLVEDNKANQMFIKIVLDELGLSYDVANDGVEAIELFNQNSYDAIFMDENMPNMNGIEATKRILEIEQKNLLKHTPIIALTANALKGDREKFLNAGMDEYLTKPVNIQQITQTLIPLLSKD